MTNPEITELFLREKLDKRGGVVFGHFSLPVVGKSFVIYRFVNG